MEIDVPGSWYAMGYPGGAKSELRTFRAPNHTLIEWCNTGNERYRKSFGIDLV